MITHVRAKKRIKKQFICQLFVNTLARARQRCWPTLKRAAVVVSADVPPLEIGVFCRLGVHLNSIAAARETRPESV